MMTASFEETLISVWRQALVEDRRDGHGRRRELSSPAHQPIEAAPRSISSSKKALARLEQNPKTNSRWARLAQAGRRVMQFLADGRYIANVVDGKVQFYGPSGRGE